MVQLQVLLKMTNKEMISGYEHLPDDTLPSDDIMSKDSTNELDKSTDSSHFKCYLSDQIVTSGQHLVQQFVDSEMRESEHETPLDSTEKEMDLESIMDTVDTVVKPKINKRESKRIQQKKKREKQEKDKLKLTPVKEQSTRKTANSMKTKYAALVKNIMQKNKNKTTSKGFWKIQPR